MFKRSLFALPVLLLAACTPPVATPAAEPLTQTQTVPTPAQTAPPEVEFDPLAISVESVSGLYLKERWGMGRVVDTDVSSDGEKLAVSTTTGVYLYDVETGEEMTDTRSSLSIPMEGGKTPGAVAFSPDGQYLAIVNERIEIWNLVENKLETRFSNIMPDFKTDEVQYSLDGQRIALRGFRGPANCDGVGGNFQLYDVESEQQVFYRRFCPESSFSSIHFTNVGQVFFVGIDEKNRSFYETTIVDTATGDVLQRVPTEYAQYPYAVSADGSLLAVHESLFNSNATIIMDVASENVINRIKGNIRYLPESDAYLIQERTDRGLGPWQLIGSDGQKVCEIVEESRFGKGNTNISYIGTAKSFVQYRYGRELKLWSTSDCRLLQAFTFPWVASTMQYSPDGTRLAVSDNFDLHILNAASGELFTNLMHEDDERLSRVFSFTQDGTQLIAVTGDYPTRAKVFNVITGMEQYELDWDKVFVGDIQIAPNSNLVAVSSKWQLSIWDFEEGLEYFAIPKPARTIFREIDFSPDGSQLALVYSSDGKISLEIRNVETKRLGGLHNISDFSKVVFNEDWSYFAFLDTSDKRIAIWHVDEERIMDTNIRHIHPTPEYFSIKGISFGPDNHLFVSYEENLILFWDVTTGNFLAELVTDFTVQEIAFSPDGLHMATTGDDGTVRIWAIREEDT